MKSFISFFIMLVLGSILILIGVEDIYLSVVLSLLNYLLCFYIINNNSLSKNILNPQSILMLGFLIFFMGRFVGLILNPSYLEILFCIDFIFNYCSSGEEIFRLLIYINCILIFFAMGFLIPLKIRNTESSIYISSKSSFYIFLLGLVCVLFSVVEGFKSVLSAINSGYLTLYEGQTSEYETPFSLIINSILISILAILFVAKNLSIKNSYYFKVLFYLFVFKMLISVLGGSRASFVGACIVLLWYFFGSKKLFFKDYFFLTVCALTLISFINEISSFTKARVLNNDTLSFFENIAFIFYNQGTTLMVFNSGLKLDFYPVLGYFKVLIPGIQVIFPYFGVTERKDFNWSSYMTYNENVVAYYNGNGLGWSIFSDFYAFSFGFLPLFCLFVFCFSRFILNSIACHSFYHKGVVFMMIVSFFAINRASISNFIFIFIFYTLMYLFFVKFKWK